ncbi:MAG: hypothetical protein Q9160_008436 [Pyrenula sp. 1 TL-2023]
MAAPTARTPSGETSEKSTNRDVHDRFKEDELPSNAKSSANSISTLQRYWIAIKWYLLDQWFLLAVSLGIIISSQVQVPEARQHQKETVVTYLCVSIIFLVTGCTLSTRTLLQNYSKWKIHLFVQVQCYLLTSVLAFGIVSACATNPNFMDSGLLVGLILMGCVPTTIASNVVMTRQAHGNQALTVVESTLGNFLGPFLTPVLLKMYTSSGAWYTKVLPLDSGGFAGVYRRAVGQTIRNLFPEATQKVFAKLKMNKIGSICLVVIIWSAYDQAFQTGAFTSVKSDNMIFVVFISVALFALYLAICFYASILWLSRADTISVVYCVPAKTPAMGIPLTQTMFTGLSSIVEAKIQIPMVIYQGIQVAAGSLLTIAWRKWIESEKERNSRNKDLRSAEDSSAPQLRMAG